MSISNQCPEKDLCVSTAFNASRKTVIGTFTEDPIAKHVPYIRIRKER